MKILVLSLLGIALEHRDRVDTRLIAPRVNWRTTADVIGSEGRTVEAAAAE